MDVKNRAQAALVGLAVAALYAGFALVAFIFAEPPPDKRKVTRAVAEKVLVVFSGAGLAMLSAPWAADLTNAVLAMSPVKLAFKVDPMTAAAVVSGLTVVLIADPTARQRLFAWVKAKVPGGV
jgi:phage terminase large subunit-like protein